MSELDALLENASNNTAGVFSLSGETLAVLFFALSFVQDIETWKDYPDEPLTDAQIDQIVELVDWANDELMREADAMAVGATMTWHTLTPPTNHLICNGQSVLKTEWPELYAVWGNKYGSTSTHFNVLDMRDRSPLGMGTWFEGLDSVMGEFNITLGITEIPAHAHRVPKMSATVNAGVNTVTANARTESLVSPLIMTESVGGGQPHLNLHPVKSVHYIVYAGKQVT